MQSAYGPHVSGFSKEYHLSVAHVLDRVGLRLSLSQADSSKVGDLFLFILNNFFSELFVGMSNFQLQKFAEVNIDHQESVKNHFIDFLLMCEDVLTNEIDIPYAINSIISSQINTKCKQFIDDHSYYREHAIDVMNKISDLLLGKESRAIVESNKQELFDLFFIIIKDKKLIEDYLVHIETIRDKPRKQVSLMPYFFYNQTGVKSDVWEKIERQRFSLDTNEFQSSLTKNLLAKYIDKSVFKSLKCIDRCIDDIVCNSTSPNDLMKVTFKRLLIIVKRQVGRESMDADFTMSELLKKHGLSTKETTAAAVQTTAAAVQTNASSAGLNEKQSKQLEKLKGKKQSLAKHFSDQLDNETKEVDELMDKLPNQLDSNGSQEQILKSELNEAKEYMPIYLMFDNVRSVNTVCDERVPQKHPELQ